MYELSQKETQFLQQHHSKHLTVKRYRTHVNIDTKQYVGLIVLPSGTRIEIRPKVPIRNLLYMVSYTYDLVSFNYFDSKQVTMFTTPIGMYVLVFFNWLDVLVKRGLHKEYRKDRKRLPVIKGRIVISKGIDSRSRILCEYQYLSKYNRYNSIIRSILDHITQNVDLSFDPDLEARLSSYVAKFSEFSRIELDSKLFAGQAFNSQNRHYKKIFDLGEVIINGNSIVESPGNTEFSGYILNMNTIFERFILRVLQKKLPRETIQSQYTIEGYTNLDPKSPVKAAALRADIVISKKLVVDAKYCESPYSNSEGTILNRDHIRQIGDYADKYRLNGVLVYPHTKGELEIKMQGTGKSKQRIGVLSIPLNADNLNYENVINDFISRVMTMYTKPSYRP